MVLHSPWLKLRDIEIVGAERADVAGRLARAGIGPGAFMIWLQPGEVDEAVRADPWVRDVRVERIFPNRLVVEVLEHTAAVWVGEAAEWMLLSEAGYVVAAAEAPGEGLLRARLPWEHWEPGERAVRGGVGRAGRSRHGAEPGAGRRGLGDFRGGELWIEARGFRARLGPAVDLADKGRAFEALLASGLPEGAVIDLVAPTRPAVSVPGPSRTMKVKLWWRVRMGDDPSLAAALTFHERFREVA